MVGTIERLVVDPDQTNVTHLVVKEGALLDEDSLVPVEEVDRTTADDSVILRSGVASTDFDPFVEDRYRRVTVERPMFGPPGLALYPLDSAPEDFVGWSADRGEPTASTASEPAGSPSIEPGSPVLTSDGHTLGRVDEIVTRDDGRIDGLIVKSGFLWWRRHWLIPHAWVRRITDDVVHIGASKDEVHDHASANPTWMTRTE